MRNALWWGESVIKQGQLNFPGNQLLFSFLGNLIIWKQMKRKIKPNQTVEIQTNTTTYLKSWWIKYRFSYSHVGSCPFNQISLIFNDTNYMTQKFVFSRHFEFLKQVGMSITKMPVCSSDMDCGLLWVSLWLNFWDDALSFYMTLWQTKFVLQPQPATCYLSKLQLDLLISKVEFQITFSFPISFTN